MDENNTLVGLEYWSNWMIDFDFELNDKNQYKLHFMALTLSTAKKKPSISSWSNLEIENSIGTLIEEMQSAILEKNEMDNPEK